MPLLTLEVRVEPDIVLARQRARQIAGAAGLCPARPDPDRHRHVRDRSQRRSVCRWWAESSLSSRPGAAPALVIRVRERGPGIRDLQAILDGEYVSTTGPGPGNHRRQAADGSILDRVGDRGRGPRSRWPRACPNRATASRRTNWRRISAELAGHAPQGLLEELQQQNQELLSTLQELREQPGGARPDAQPRAR